MSERTTCWHCGRGADAAGLDYEAVLVPRTAGKGGPVLLWHCPDCGVSSVVERNRAGERLLVPPPLFGVKLDDPRGPVAAAARRWTAENLMRRDSFHARTRPADAPAPATAPPAAATPDRPESRSEPAPEPEPERPSPREVSSVLEAYEILGLPLTADAGSIHKRFRELTKKCHPDRVAGLDEEIRRTAERRWREIRRAYEVLTGE